MLVADVKALAKEWVEKEAVGMHDFGGAFFHGSVTELSDSAAYPANSDVDICIVLHGSETPAKLGKFLYHDLLFEVTYVAWYEISSPEKVLGQYHLAGSFRWPSIIFDPNGKLEEIHRVVAENFAKREWVRRRCQHAVDRIVRGLGSAAGAALPDQVNAWLFPAGITTHVLLVAGLRNPTVRKRFAAAKKLLSDYGCDGFYPRLLDLVGCTHLTPQEVECRLNVLAEIFDLAKEVPDPPFFFASDISDAARHIAIDGSRELIAAGLHREAVFWMLATLCRCHKILAYGGTAAELDRADQSLWDFLHVLGIHTTAGIAAAQAKVKAILPQVWEVAEVIIERNPAVSV